MEEGPVPPTAPLLRMEIGLELRLPWEELATCGLAERELDLRSDAGVPGGVGPLPLARLSPMILTRSLTDTPWSSGGMSLAGVKGFLATGGLEEAPLDLAGPPPIASERKNFWKKFGFLASTTPAECGAAGGGVDPRPALDVEPRLACEGEDGKDCLGNGTGLSRDLVS